MAESKTEAWQKTERVLGTPVFDEFPENTLRIRRNLLIVGSLALAYKLNNLTVSPDSSLFGVKFDGLTNGVIDQTFFWLIAYHLVHFGWNSLVDLQGWRVRVTGTRLAHGTGSSWASEEGDYPDDPRQSSLYTWWSEQGRRVGHIGEDAKDLQDNIQSWRLTLEQLPESINQPNIIASVVPILTNVNDSAINLHRNVEQINKTLLSTRIPVSLKRFDRWYRMFQWNQLVKWAVIEWCGPIILGIWAACKVFPFSL